MPKHAVGGYDEKLFKGRRATAALDRYLPTWPHGHSREVKIDCVPRFSTWGDERFSTVTNGKDDPVVLWRNTSEQVDYIRIIRVTVSRMPADSDDTKGLDVEDDFDPDSARLFIVPQEFFDLGKEWVALCNKHPKLSRSWRAYSNQYHGASRVAIKLRFNESIQYIPCCSYHCRPLGIKIHLEVPIYVTGPDVANGLKIHVPYKPRWYLGDVKSVHPSLLMASEAPAKSWTCPKCARWVMDSDVCGWCTYVSEEYHK